MEHAEKITLFAEPLGHIGSFPITNSIIASTVSTLIILLLVLFLRKKALPGKLQSIFELLIEGALSLADQVTNDRKISQKVMPLGLAIFVFVLLNNWFGLLPLGGIFFGANPLFRGGTADVNTTIALALIAVIGANAFGIFSLGLWKTFNKYVNLKALHKGARHAKKEPTGLIVAPVMFFVGILELIGEFAKVASLSFRLFGNVFAGEVLLASMAAIVAYVLPLPFYFLEVMVGVIQALIFAMLATVYFTIAAQDHEEHEEHDAKHAH